MLSKAYLTDTPCSKSGAARRSHLAPEARGGDLEEPPTPEARAIGREEQPHVQGAVASQVQEGLEELFHVEGQEGWR